MIKISLFDRKTNKRIVARISEASLADLPLKKDRWQFNWRQLFGEAGSKTCVLKTSETKHNPEGIISLKIENGMLIMNHLEIAPRNVGSKNKQFDSVAGCLIAFACRESFKIKGIYKGYLAFVSKTSLIEWYKNKYGAEQIAGQRMIINPMAGEKLINKYLKSANYEEN